MSTEAALSAAHVAELVREIAPEIVGRTVREVEALPPADLLLVLAGDERHSLCRLRLSADPAAARLHLQHGRVERHTGPAGPFFRAAREELAGARVRRLAQVAADRIVMLDLEGETGERRALVLELFGRHANLVLLGGGERVLAVLVPPPAEKTDARLVAGQPWSPPADRGARRAAPEPAALRDAFPAPPEAAPGGPATAPLSWIVESALGGQAREVRHASLQRKLEQRAQRKLERARALLAGLEQRALASAQSERVRQDGELVKANLAALRRGLAKLEVDDFFALDASGGAPRRTIALDPKLGPRENLERLFERARKLERARDQVASEIELARRRIEALEALLARARAEGSDPEALDAEAVARGLLDAPQEGDLRKRKEPPARLPYRTFTALRGTEIRVGRSARDNDQLTFRHARGNDLWLHTADAPGSHVVLRAARDADPDAEELLDAAHLAVHFSPLAGRARAQVHVARQKEVKKPRGAKPGLVTLSGGRILDVRMQPERLARLVRSQRAGDGGAGRELG